MYVILLFSIFYFLNIPYTLTLITISLNSKTSKLPDASAITSGTFAAARIPDLNASKITAGTLAADRIPNLAAGKITSGTLAADRVPNLNASKITAGTLAWARMPIVIETKEATITSTIAANSYMANKTVNVAKSGYTPRAVAGAWFSGSGISFLLLYDNYLTGTSYHYSCRNLANVGAQPTKIFCRVIYTKD